MKPLFKEDLDHVLKYTQSVWPELRNSRLFITGGTGFFGKWLLESFAHANRELSLNAKAVVLSRNPGRFFAEMPHLADQKCLEFIQGDVTDFAFPPGEFQWIVHAAADFSPSLVAVNPLVVLDTTVQGTRRALDLAARGGCRGFLLTSSGAVYGPQPHDLTHIPESYNGAPDPMDPNATYANGKRMAEHLCCLYHQERDIPTKIARCFAFVGPHLALDSHFAISNFIRDGMAGRPVKVNGDGTPLRSYLYAADLAIWLWTILAQGKSCVPYNVGDDKAITIAKLAQTVAEIFNTTAQIQSQAVPGKPVTQYVPCIQRSRELSLERHIDLDVAIRRTTLWLSQQ